MQDLGQERHRNVHLEIDFDMGILLRNGKAVSPVPLGWDYGMREVRALVIESETAGRTLTISEALAVLYRTSANDIQSAALNCVQTQ